MGRGASASSTSAAASASSASSIGGASVGVALVVRSWGCLCSRGWTLASACHKGQGALDPSRMRFLGLVNRRRRRGCGGSLSGLRRIAGTYFRLGESLKDQFVLLEFLMSFEEFSITVTE